MKSVVFVILFVLTMAALIVVKFACGVANKTVTPDRFISNYEWFYDQYNQIQSMESNVVSLTESINSFQGDDKARKQTELQGLKMVLNNSIAEYNSKSKQITRKLWKSENLPYQLEMMK